MPNKVCMVCEKEILRKDVKRFCSYECYWGTLVGRITWNKGKKTGKLSEDHRKKIGLANMGHIGHTKGKHLSEETKDKISVALTGVKLSAETRKKMSIAMKGRLVSEETKQKFSNIFKGKPWSEARRKAQEKLTGCRSRKPVIKNGKEYSENWHEIRKEIYERDKWICRECGVKCRDKKGNSLKRIQCHHIDYDILNCKSVNLITLCASCHSKTNFKREDWMKYYQLKMEKLV